MDPNFYLNYFSSTKNKSALKVKVPTSIKRGTTCCFQMTVFPPSTHNGSSPSLVLLMGSWHPTNLPLIGKNSTGPQTNLNVMHTYILDFPETSIYRPSCKEASMILKFTAELLRMRQWEGRGRRQSLHCWCYKLRTMF